MKVNWEKGVAPMEVMGTYRLSETVKRRRQALLSRCGIAADENVDYTALLYDGETLVAAGSRRGNILKCIAVDETYQGEGLTATLLTELRREAFDRGLTHLFLYTKPKNKLQFTSLFFYPVAETADVLLLENVQDGITQFINTLDGTRHTGRVGAAVMHCNPFTLGHRYLVETAAGECDHLYIFVLSEEGGPFPAADRLRLVKAGTEDIPNVTVLPTGPYLISSATFPDYFLRQKTDATRVQCELDAELFLRYFAPHFGITARYVGTEPLSPLTEQYNGVLKAYLPPRGIEVREIERKTEGDVPISASRVRALLGQNAPEQLRHLVPATTFTYLEQRQLI